MSRRQHRSALAPTFALALLAAPATAQQVAPNPTAPPLATDGEEVVVLGRGLALPPGTPAYGATVIDRARLTGDASGRVEDVLADVAGLQQFRRSDSRSANPSAQGVTLRALGGNATSRALVLLDGVPIADPFFGYVPFTALSPERLSAVRVTRGGGSGPFGAGAVAGTIELVSAGRADLPLVAGEAALGSFDSSQLAASISPDLGAGFVTVSARAERSDGFYTTPVNQRVAATARARFRDWSAGIRGVAPIGADTELQAAGTVFDDHRTLRFAGADSTSSGEDASIRLIHRGGWQVDALAYLQARNFTNKVISATTFRLALDQRNTPATGYGGKVELRPPVGGDHLLRIGLDIRTAQGTLYEDAYNATTGAATAYRRAGGNSSTTGAFVEDDWTIGRLVLTGGGRVDRWTIADGFFRERDAALRLTSDQRFGDRAGTIATGRAGVLFHAARTLDLRAAAYTGFRVPTLNELYRPFVVFPVTTQANAALGLEKLRGAEVGADLHAGGWLTLAATGFVNRLGGAVANVTITPTLRQRQNVDAIVARGLELTVGVHRRALSLDASYAFNDAHVHASGAQAALDGFVPAQSPRHVASATLAWTPRAGPLLSATLRTIGRQYEDDRETDVLPAATTLDAVARYPLTDRLAVFARGENVFDATVVTRNQAGSIDLGTPRTLWIGLSIGR